MAKTTKVVSLSVKPDMHEKWTKISEARGIHNLSKLVGEVMNDFAEIGPETYVALKQSAEKKSIPISELVEYLVDKFPLEDDTVQPIVLKVPVSIMSDRDRLQAWLNSKSNALVNYLHPGTM